MNPHHRLKGVSFRGTHPDAMWLFSLVWNGCKLDYGFRISHRGESKPTHVKVRDGGAHISTLWAIRADSSIRNISFRIARKKQ